MPHKPKTAPKKNPQKELKLKPAPKNKVESQKIRSKFSLEGRYTQSYEPLGSFIKRMAQYAFFTILVFALSILVFYRTKGYTFNNDGKLEKRGLAIINSNPDGAKVQIDNQDLGETELKLEVREGAHTLKIQKEGYQTWQKDFYSQIGDVDWFYYPQLVKTNPSSQKFLENLPVGLLSEPNAKDQVLNLSIDSAEPSRLRASLIDFKEENPAKAQQELELPADLISTTTPLSLTQLEFVEWSPNGDSAQLKYTLPDGSINFLNLNIDAPLNSQNLSLKIPKKIHQVHYSSSSRLYVLAEGAIALYNPKTLALESQITALEDPTVLSFKSSLGSSIIYLKTESATDSVNSGSLYLKKEDISGEARLIQKFSGTPELLAEIDYEYSANRRQDYLSVLYPAVGSFTIFKNPLTFTEDKVLDSILYSATLPELQSKEIKLNPPGQPQPGRYLALQTNPKTIFMYDLEKEDYFYTHPGAGSSAILYGHLQNTNPTELANLPSLTRIAWIDSHHLQGLDENGQVYAFDYDGNYLNLMGSTNSEFAIFLKEGGGAITSQTVTAPQADPAIPAGSSQTLTLHQFSEK